MVKHFVDKQIFPLSTTHIELRPVGAFFFQNWLGQGLILQGSKDTKLCNYEIHTSLPILQDYNEINDYGSNMYWL